LLSWLLWWLPVEEGEEEGEEEAVVVSRVFVFAIADESVTESGRASGGELCILTPLQPTGWERGGRGEGRHRGTSV
jgi:hypothetical protein